MCTRRILSTGLVTLLASVGIFTGGRSSLAKEGTWTVDADGSWSSALNWKDGTIPDGVGDVANFNVLEPGGPRVIFLHGSRTVGTLNLGDPSNGEAYTFTSVGTGGSLVLESPDNAAKINITTSGSGPNVFNVPLLLKSNTEISTTTFQEQLFNGSISGPGSLTIDANGVHPAGTPGRTGQVRLAGVNTFKGGLTIGEGARVQAGTALSFGEGSVTVKDGGQAFLGVAGVFANNFTLNGLGWDETTHRQLGALRSDANSTLNGSIVLASPDVRLASNNPKAATLINGVISESVTGANLDFGRWDPDAVNAIAVSAGGTFIINSTTAYTGKTFVSSGTLQIGNGGTTGDISSSSGIVFGRSNTDAEPNQTATLVFNRSNNVTLTMPVSETVNGAGNTVTGSLRHSGTGVLTWASSGNGYSGTTTVDGSNGKLVFGTGGAFTFKSTAPISISNGADLEFNTSSPVTLNQTITGAASSFVIQSGSGTLTIGGGTTNNVEGRVEVNSGKVVLAKASNGSVHAVSSTAANALSVVVNGGVLQLEGTGGDQIDAGSTVRLDGGTFDMNGRSEGFDVLQGREGTITNTSSTAANLTIGEAGLRTYEIVDRTFSGVIKDGAGQISLRKKGAETQILTGQNTYTGDTDIDEGVLVVSGSLAATGKVNLTGQATLRGGGSIGNLTVSGGKLEPGDGISDGSSRLLSVQSLTMYGGSMGFDIGATSDRLDVAGTANLAVQGINVRPTFSTVPVPSTYTLINAGKLTMLGMPVIAGTNGGRFTMALDATTQPNHLLLTISGSNKALTWTGANSAEWDLNTTNWKDGTADERFYEFDTVSFTDSAAKKTVSLRVIGNVGGITVNNSVGNDYIFNGGSITGPTGIHKSGAGTLTINTYNSYTGPVVIDGGKLVMGTASAIGAPSNSVVVNSGGSLDFGGQYGSLLQTFSIAGSGTAGEGALVNNGRAGDPDPTLFSLTLTGDATIGGTSAITIGTRERQSNISGNGHILTKTGTSVLRIRGTTGSLSSLGGVTINGGVLVLEQADDILGSVPVTVNTGGSITAALDYSRAWKQSNPVILKGGTITTFGGDVSWNGPITIQSGSGKFNASGSPLTISGSISDNGYGFTKTGSGTVFLTNSNNVTGPVTVTDGTLSVGNGGATGALSAPNAFNVSGAGILRYNLLGAASLPANVNLQTSSTFAYRGPTQDSTLTISKTVGSATTTQGTFLVESGTARLVNGSNINVSAVNVGAFPTPDPIQDESFPSGINTGSIGTLNISDGAHVSTTTFRIGTSVPAGFGGQYTESGIVNQSGGTVAVLGADETSGFFDGPFSIGRSAATGSQYNLSGGTLSVPNGSIDIGTDSVASSLNISGGLASVKRIEIDGRSANAPIGGALNLSGGELSVGSGGIQAANNGTGLTLVNIAGGTLSASASSTWAVGMNFDTDTATINTGANTVTVSGALVGPGGFTKTGTGSLVLSNAANLVNTVRVNAGSLVVNGSLSGSVTVNSGTLTGSGTTGAVTVAAGGTLAPGNGFGILNVGDASFSGGKLALEIKGAQAGTQYDQLNVRGIVDLLSDTVITLSLTFDPVDNVDSFVIIANDGTEPVRGSGLFSYNSKRLSEGSVFLVNSQQFRITYAGGTDGNDVVLFAIPEPGNAQILAAAFSASIGLSRFRRKTKSTGGILQRS